MSNGVWKIATVILSAALVLSLYGALYYYGQFASVSFEKDELRRELNDVSVKVDIAVDFGNETRIWYNNTVVQLGCSVFNATFLALKGNLAYQVYHSPTLSGIFVTAIHGVASSSSAYWLWYIFDAQKRNWTEPAVGADQLFVINDGIYSWVYTEAL